MKNSIKGLIGIFAFLAVVTVVTLLIIKPGQASLISITKFETYLNNGEVESVSLDGAEAELKLTGGTKARVVYYPTTDLNSLVSEFNQKYKAHNAAIAKPEASRTEEDMAAILKDSSGNIINRTITLIEYKQADPNSGNIWSTLIPILGIVLLAVLAFFMLRNMSGSNRQAMNFGKSKARSNDNIKVKFNDVAGAEEEKEELKEIVEFLKNPAKFSSVGARIPKGVLLVGPPGTGKTLFAKAVAGEANVPFFSISGSDFVEMFVGVGASRVRDLFDQAKRNMPCIIFIDEIDAVGRQRGTGLGGGHDEREQTLNQLLVQMDGFETNDGIIVMAATNRADILDPALLRPGRFDRQIYVHIPDVRGREAILKVHARNKPISSDVDYKILARITSGFTGADIENLLNEAAILAARDNRKIITMRDLNEGINKVIMGPQKKSRLVTEVDKRITAYHEAGHAIVAKLLPNCDPVHEVSIIPRGQAAGYTMMRPDNDDDHMPKGKLLDVIAMSMGGRAAEEIVIKDICTGAQGDIKQATSLAKKMVTEWGMSEELGPIFLGSDQEVFLGRDYTSTHTYSEAVAARIDAEVHRIVEAGHQKALKILNEHRDVMDRMVRLLIEKETIYAEEVDMLLEGKSVEEVAKYIDDKNANPDKRGSDYTYAAKKFSDVIIGSEKRDDGVIPAEGRGRTRKPENDAGDNNSEEQ